MASPATAFDPSMFMPPQAGGGGPNRRFLGLPSGGRMQPQPMIGGGGGEGTAPGQNPVVSHGFSASNPQQPQAPQGPYTPQYFSSGPMHGNTSAMQDAFSSSADTEKANESALLGRSSGILDFASGNPQDSPLYKSLLSSSRSAIGNSYDQAVANTRASAASRGFGYASPNEEGMEAGTRAQESGALAAAPSTALQETIAPELQAAGIDTSQAGIMAGQSTADLGMMTALQQARMNKSASTLNGIMQMVAAMQRSAAAGANA